MFLFHGPRPISYLSSVTYLASPESFRPTCRKLPQISKLPSESVTLWTAPFIHMNYMNLAWNPIIEGLIRGSYSIYSHPRYTICGYCRNVLLFTRVLKIILYIALSVLQNEPIVGPIGYKERWLCRETRKIGRPTCKIESARR